jgi:hypothetical protein
VIRRLENGRHVVLPNRSHNDIDPCVARLIESFVIRGSSADLDTTCVAASPPLRFATSAASGR